MTAARTKTLWFNLSEVPNVSENEYVDWIRDLGLVFAEVATLDYNFRTKSLVLCFKEAAQHVRFETALPDPLFFKKGESEHIVVVSSTPKRTKTVRAYPVHENMGLESLKTELGRYGRVLSVRREHGVVSGLPTEAVLTTMELRDDIPQHTMIKGMRVSIWYSQQSKTCRFCGSADHMVDKCPKLSAKSSYASFLAGKKPVATAANTTKTPTKTTTTPTLTITPEPRVNSKATAPSQTGRIEADKGRGSSQASSLSPATPILDAIVLVTPLSPTRCSNKFGVLASLPCSEEATPEGAETPYGKRERAGSSPSSQKKSSGSKKRRSRASEGKDASGDESDSDASQVDSQVDLFDGEKIPKAPKIAHVRAESAEERTETVNETGDGEGGAELLRPTTTVDATPVVIQEEETPSSPYRSAWNASPLDSAFLPPTPVITASIFDNAVADLDSPTVIGESIPSDVIEAVEDITK